MFDIKATRRLAELVPWSDRLLVCKLGRNQMKLLTFDRIHLLLDH